MLYALCHGIEQFHGEHLGRTRHLRTPHVFCNSVGGGASHETNDPSMRLNFTRLNIKVRNCIFEFRSKFDSNRAWKKGFA